MRAIDRNEIENFKIELISSGIPNGNQSVCFDFQAALFSRVRCFFFPTQDGPLEDVVSLLPLNSVSKIGMIALQNDDRKEQQTCQGEEIKRSMHLCARRKRC
jgi:hypothetical protein